MYFWQRKTKTPALDIAIFHIFLEQYTGWGDCTFKNILYVITESWDQITLDYYMFGYMNNMIGLFGAQRETGPGKGLGAERGTSGVAGKWDR